MGKETGVKKFELEVGEGFTLQVQTELRGPIRESRNTEPSTRDERAAIIGAAYYVLAPLIQQIPGDLFGRVNTDEGGWADIEEMADQVTLKELNGILDQEARYTKAAEILDAKDVSLDAAAIGILELASTAGTERIEAAKHSKQLEKKLAGIWPKN